MLKTYPFTFEQVERFAHKWYLANVSMSKQKNDRGVQMLAQAEADDLLHQLRNTPTLLALTVNPLLLTMIAIAHRHKGGGKLPKERVSLYANICEVFLGRRQEAREQNLELKPEKMQLVLEPLAFYMMQQGIREITPAQSQAVIEKPMARVNAQMSVENFLKLVENVSGLLLERENGIYSFAHLTFQEYLTATHVNKKHLVKALIAHVGDSWWHEAIRLYCAMADATPIIEACLAGDFPSIPALVLAFDCQKEALELQTEAKAHLETILSQGIEDTDPQRQHIAAEVLLTRRLRQMVYLKKNTFIDTSLITGAEYQLFLDEQRAQGKYFQPDHWMGYRFSPSNGSTPVLGVRSSDAAAFCEWLTNRETDPWRYRLPMAGELPQTGDENILNNFPTGAGYWSNTGFVWLKEPQFLPRTIIQGFIDRDRAPALNRALDLNRDLDRILDLARTRTHDSDRARTRARDLALARALALTFTRALALEPDLDLERDLTRVRDLDLAYYSFHQKSSSKRARDEMQSLIDGHLDIYTTLAILEERVQDKLPAWEGILIVKERKQEHV